MVTSTRRDPRNLPDVSAVAETMKNEYRAAKRSRFRRNLSGYSSSGSGADYHYASERDFLYMLELSRDFGRNDPIVGQGIRRLVANVVQKGFGLDVDTNNKELDKRLTEKWQAWAGDEDLCHNEQEHCFTGDMERLTFQNIVLDGDVFPIGRGGNIGDPGTGSLQFMEAHRCRTPTWTKKNRSIVHGVEMEEDNARRKAYFFTHESLDPRATVKLGEMSQVFKLDKKGRRQVFHAYNPDRFSQRRGVPVVAPIADMAGMHDDIHFATLVAQQIQSCWAVIEELQPGNPVPGAPGSGGGNTGDRTTETTAGGFQKVLENIAPGMRVTARDGYTIKGFKPTIPAPPFFQHAMLVLSIIAVNLDIPVAVLLLDPTRTNFSGWRGAIDQSRGRFEIMQDQLKKKFHSRVYRWKVGQWIESDDRIERLAGMARTNPFEHIWNPPTWDYIEPLKDASADVMITSSGMNDWGSVQRKRGRDPDKVLDRVIKWNLERIRRAQKAADDFAKEFPQAVPITWRDVAQTPLPQGVTMSIDPGGTDQNEPTEPDTQPGAAQNASQAE